MKTFATLDAASTAYAELNTKFESLQGDMSAAEALAEEAGKKQADAEAALVTSKEAVTKIEAALQKETERAKSLETEVFGLKSNVEKLEAEAKTAEEQAASICAAAGIDPVALNPASDMGSGSMLEQYNAIKDPVEKSAFLKQHQSAIYKESNKKG
jgi:chromosome segregation ATPase